MSDASPAPPAAIATVAIATKNRKDDLRTTLQSIQSQDVPVEIIVIDDGSNDGTADMVRSGFPDVRLHRLEVSEGYVAGRNRAARLASTPFIFSLDDDAVMTGPDTVCRTLAEFDHPRVAAVAMPFININQEQMVRQRAPTPDGHWIVDSYVGTAHALRREVFLGLGGYREVLFHQGEEQDLCIRLLAAGFFTRLGLAAPIHHMQSPVRSRRRMVVFAARNNVLFAWHNVPMLWLLQHWAGTTLNLLRFGLRRRELGWVLEGLVRGYGRCLAELARRKPVSLRTYRLYRRLRKTGPLRLEEIED